MKVLTIVMSDDDSVSLSLDTSVFYFSSAKVVNLLMDFTDPGGFGFLTFCLYIPNLDSVVNRISARRYCALY